MMMTVGQKFPDYDIQGVVTNSIVDAFQQFNNESHAGKWSVYVFWPKDFTFVCPTEIIAYGQLNRRFQELNAQLYGVSTDSEFVHLAWRESHPGLSDLPYPMLSDLKRELSWELGVLHEEEGVCLRATYIVDPEGVIRHVSVNDLSVGRNPEETLRLLNAFQTGELTPCNWQVGEDVIKIGD